MVLAHDITQGLRTQDVQVSEDITFDTMLLAPNTLEGLTNAGFYKPSPIQLHGIPLGKCGFDLLLEAKSGTGKTAVFTIIALEKISLEIGVQTIILAPTREIAYQICDVIKQIGLKYEKLNVEVIIGGLPVQEDIVKFKSPVQVVVATPGRLRHLIQAKHIDVSAVRLLILDEADKLMDKSFQTDINYIFKFLPKEKQVIMSSATYPEQLKTLMKLYVQNAQHICPDSTNILLGIKQFIITVKYNSNIVKQTQFRFEELLKILSKKHFKQCLIFCNYQVRVRDLCKMLTREKWPAEQLHGQQDQADRLDALKTLQEYKCRILVSTDLAARGIDASNVDLVINFEPPLEWQVYLHRIGRAGRFGSYGMAVTILSKGDEELKFKKVMSAINVDLRNFWDEEKNILNNAEHTTSEYSELFNKLTSNVQCDGVIENVEILRNTSAYPLESKIESFDELLSHFESHEFSSSLDLNIECNNNNNSISNALDTDVSPKLNLNKTTNEELEENLLLIRNIFHTGKDQNSTSSSKEIPSSKEKMQHVIECNKRNELPSENVVDIDKEIQDLGSEDTDKALLAAGLPTFFNSSKMQRKEKRLQTRMELSNNRNRRKDIDLQQDSKVNKVQSFAKFSRIEEDKIRLQNVGVDSNLSGRYINKDVKPIDKSKKVQELKTQNYTQINEYHVNSQTYVCEAMNWDKKYKTWYKQLKSHIQQVQMALYIQELSEM
ncbi:probable ATP-dependent RNA helicase DDX20 [Trichoplusia ni]|uniref:RNA helicase n=1 Tax=Trichoplusia ni TaxID=7111 RepID=A0A7E5WCX7_TRINI|nr:probable ATP-dependent RNA helicase DDX20 [Trichoplusia ni]